MAKDLTETPTVEVPTVETPVVEVPAVETPVVSEELVTVNLATVFTNANALMPDGTWGDIKYGPGDVTVPRGIADDLIRRNNLFVQGEVARLTEHDYTMKTPSGSFSGAGFIDPYAGAQVNVPSEG